MWHPPHCRAKSGATCPLKLIPALIPAAPTGLGLSGSRATGAPPAGAGAGLATAFGAGTGSEGIVMVLPSMPSISNSSFRILHRCISPRRPDGTRSSWAASSIAFVASSRRVTALESLPSASNSCAVSIDFLISLSDDAFEAVACSTAATPNGHSASMVAAQTRHSPKSRRLGSGANTSQP